MCGICGRYNFQSGAPVRREDIEQMTRTMVHRGPDDEGYYLDDSIALGFRRLSIIDLEGGHQPMSDREESVWVVFNGEIYNFPALKSELESLGQQFRTKCDTEVIVLGYKQWGDDVLNHLNGMFGLAIWDTRRRRLLVARDPFGIKPIYYRIDKGSVFFGSEIRPVIATSTEKPEVDPVSLNLFLRFRFAASPKTVFKGVQKLAPGSRLIFEKGQFRSELWSQFKPVPFSPMVSENEAREELLRLYKLSIKRHLLSDVPVGLLLSGGVDSALLLALMNLYGDSWRTYTVGYGASFADDELNDAAETAACLKSQHTAVLLNQQTFEETLPRIVACLEEPVATASIVPMYFVCERARKDVKVALIGQGPDELFGGYNRHVGVRYGGLWGGLPQWVRDPIAAAIGALPRNDTLKRGVRSFAIPDRLRRYQQVFSIQPGEKVDGLFQEGLIGPDAGDQILSCWRDFAPLLGETDELGGFQFLELRSTLPDELLMYADKLSMAHGLEARVPYLDKEIVEFAERLRANFKVRNGSGKWLHRQVCKNFLPANILKRKKRGFAVNVVDSWFQSAVGGHLSDLLLDGNSLMFKLLKVEPVRKLLEDHQAGLQDNHKL